MSEGLRLLGAALVAGILYPLVRQYAPAVAPVLAAGVSALMLWLALTTVQDALFWLRGLIQDPAAGDAFWCLVRCAGILLCAGWCRDLCRDGGLSAAAGVVEFAGRCLSLAAALPLLQEVFAMLGRFAGL